MCIKGYYLTLRLNGRIAMKKVRAKNIIVGILTIMLVVTGILPFMTKKASAAENTLSEKITLITENETRDSAKDNYSKVTFKINDTSKEIYVKNGDKITLKSTDKNYGVLIGGIENGKSITDDTTVYVKSYAYADVLKLEKTINDSEPDENEMYTLNFSVETGNLPSIESDSQSVILVIDRSLSMACSVDDEADTDPMAPSYEKTRWGAMMQAVDNFLNEFLPEGSSNKVSVVTYCRTADKLIENSSSKEEIMNSLNAIYNRDMYNEDYKDLLKRNNCVYISRGLGSSTNIEQGIKKAGEILNNNAAGSSVILFTDGAANTYDEQKIRGNYYINDEKYTGSESNMNGSYYANKAGKQLAEKGCNIYSIVLMSNDNDITHLVKASMGKETLSYTKSLNKVRFTFTEGGYAKEFYTAGNASDLKDRFRQIMISMTSLPFETASVTDKLDRHFELVDGQDNVIDNKDGTFTINYPDKISANRQTVSVKIKAKDSYAGYSYTNDGCIFSGITDGLTYTQQFTETPAAVILPDAADDEYQVNQNEKLNASTVLSNDNNIIVNNPDKNVSVKTEIISDTKNGSVSFNEDGTFSYTPNQGYSGEDSFNYNVVLSVDGKEYKKTATVTINIIPKPEVGADEEEITQPSEQNIEEQTTQPAQSQENSEKASVQTGDSKIIFWYAALMIVLGTVIATSLIVSRKRKIR